MAETAGDVVRDALTELTIQAQEQSVPAVDLNTGIRYLNRMMAAWDATGLSFGYTKVTSPNDVLTVPDGIIEAMVFNLAIRLANGYDVPISQSLVATAAEAMQTVHLLGVRLGKTNFPSSLPVGSGSEDFSGAYDTTAFFPDCCEDANTCTTSTNGDTNGL